MAQSERERRNQAVNELSSYHAEDAIHDDSASLQAMLQKESDRGLIIILTTWIEDALVDRICRELPNGEELRKTLKTGPMRAFEHRIAIARATGAVTPHLADTLDLFRHMRNACAHCRREISLSTPALRAVFAEMFYGGQARDLILDPPSDLPEFLQGIFTLAASMTLNLLKGGSLGDYQIDVGYVSEEMRAEGRPSMIETERVLFRALQRKQTSRRASGPPPPANE